MEENAWVIQRGRRDPDIAWIDSDPNDAAWYGEVDGTLGWTTDFYGATLRFRRKEDADRVIACQGLTNAVAWYGYFVKSD
jgi:hypothetical protein